MNAYLEILRFGNAVMAAIAVILMMFVGHYYGLPIILCALIVFFATGAGNTINDVFDVKIDEVNKPHRPIPSGRISVENARNYAFFLFAVAIILNSLKFNSQLYDKQHMDIRNCDYSLYNNVFLCKKSQGHAFGWKYYCGSAYRILLCYRGNCCFSCIGFHLLFACVHYPRSFCNIHDPCKRDC